MSVFDAYAVYYDLLYAAKDYEAESQYVDQLVRSFMPNARSIADVGCGTGIHANELSKLGFDVVGYDISPEMVAEARRKFPNIDFRCQSLQDLDIEPSVDCIVSLFHVLSYQTSDEDVRDALAGSFRSLERGGLLVFDCWHGPAVLRQGAETRVLRVKGDGASVTRIAEPKYDFEANLVTVDYDVIVETPEKISRIMESHEMRYFFRPEIQKLLRSSGFELLHSEEWMTGAPPSDASWGVTYVGRRI